MKKNSLPQWHSTEKALLGENPLWDALDGSLFWIDAAEPAVFLLLDGAVTRFAMPKPVASIYLTSPGRLIVAMRRTVVELDLADGQLTPLDSLVPPSPNERFNDGRCDRDGHLWISTMDHKLERKTGSLVRIDESLGSSSFQTQARLGNGVCFSPDNRWLYFSDTFKRSIFRFPASQPGEMAAHRQLLVELDTAPGRPDGCSVDAEGFLWSARVGGGRIDRYSPEGRLVGFLETPVSHPTHCTFGGSDLKTLFVTSSRYPAGAAEFDTQELAGCVLAFDVGVKGLPEPRFVPPRQRSHAVGTAK